MKINHNILNLIIQKLNTHDKLKIIKSNNFLNIFLDKLWICNGIYCIDYFSYDMVDNNINTIYNKKYLIHLLNNIKLKKKICDEISIESFDCNIDPDDESYDELFDKYFEEYNKRNTVIIKYYIFGDNENEVCWNLICLYDNFFFIFCYEIIQYLHIFNGLKNLEIYNYLDEIIYQCNTAENKQYNFIEYDITERITFFRNNIDIMLNIFYTIRDFIIYYVKLGKDKNLIYKDKFIWKIDDNGKETDICINCCHHSLFDMDVQQIKLKIVLENINEIRNIIIKNNKKERIIECIKFFTELNKVF